MTVAQLIAELRKFPEDMPVAIFGQVWWSTKDEPDGICVSKQTCNNFPYIEPVFDFVNLE